MAKALESKVLPDQHRKIQEQKAFRPGLFHVFSITEFTRSAPRLSGAVGFVNSTGESWRGKLKLTKGSSGASPERVPSFVVLSTSLIGATLN